MSNQIFKKTVPNNILFDLLENVSLKTDKYYLIDVNAYRKILFHELQHGFCDSLKEYYHLGKQFYLERPFTNNVRSAYESPSNEIGGSSRKQTSSPSRTAGSAYTRRRQGRPRTKKQPKYKRVATRGKK